MDRTTTNSSKVGDKHFTKRLKTLHEYYHGAEVVWDIGCDHGLLGLSFLTDPRVKNIHLVDPSLAVINKLKQTLKDSYITNGNVTIHHKQGQKVLYGTESKCVFIAGMGGKEIEEIFSHLVKFLTADDLVVVSPHRKVLELRQFLMYSDLGLVKEEVVLDHDQFYPIFCLSKNPRLKKSSAYGEEIWSTLEGTKYKDHQVKFFSCHKDEASQRYVEFLKRLPH